mgnify:CR=1 FL=1
MGHAHAAEAACGHGKHRSRVRPRVRARVRVWVRARGLTWRAVLGVTHAYVFHALVGSHLAVGLLVKG